jgi:hypothetical protein
MVTMHLSFQLYLLIYAWTADGYARVHWRLWRVILVRPASRPEFKLRTGLSMAGQAVRTLMLDREAGIAIIVLSEGRRTHSRKQSDRREWAT